MDEKIGKVSIPAVVYKTSELIAKAKEALGVESYVAAGALNDLNETTIDNAKNLIEKFLKKGVK